MLTEKTALGAPDEERSASMLPGGDVASEGNQWRDTDKGFLPEDEPREWLFCTRVLGCVAGSRGTGVDFDAENADTTVRSREARVRVISTPFNVFLWLALGFTGLRARVLRR